MPITSPVSERLTTNALLLLTFATGLVDGVSVLVLGHVFVANMTGNVIFLGFWFVPSAAVQPLDAAAAFGGFVLGTIAAGRFARHLDHDRRLWLTAALGAEAVWLCGVAALCGLGVLTYHGTGRLVLLACLALAFGAQNGTARQFGVQELATTVLTSTIVGLGADSRLAGGKAEREGLRYSVLLTMLAGAMVGATLTRFFVAPIIALAAMVVMLAMLIFRYGPPR